VEHNPRVEHLKGDSLIGLHRETRLDRLALDKHSSLLSYNENSVVSAAVGS